MAINDLYDEICMHLSSCISRSLLAAGVSCCLPHSEMNEDKFLATYCKNDCNAAAFMYMLYQQTSLMQRGLYTGFGTISDVYMYFINLFLKCIVIVTCLFKLDISGFVFDMFDMYNGD